MLQIIVVIIIVVLAAVAAAYKLYRLFKHAPETVCSPDKCASCPHAVSEACVKKDAF